MKRKRQNRARAAKPKPKARAVGLQRASNGKLPGGITGKGFRPGQSGNPSGKRKGTASPTAALKRALDRESAQRIADQLVTAASNGDISAAKLIFDRVDHPLAGPLAVAMAQTVQLPGSTEQTHATIMESNEDRPLQHLSKERLRQIIALCPEVAPAETLLPRPLAPPLIVSAPAPEPEPKPLPASQNGTLEDHGISYSEPVAPESPEQPQGASEPAAPAPEPRGLKNGHDFIVFDPHKPHCEDPEPSRVGAVMSAEEFLKM